MGSRINRTRFKQVPLYWDLTDQCVCFNSLLEDLLYWYIIFWVIITQNNSFVENRLPQMRKNIDSLQPIHFIFLLFIKNVQASNSYRLKTRRCQQKRDKKNLLVQRTLSVLTFSGFFKCHSTLGLTLLSGSFFSRMNCMNNLQLC